MEVLSTGITTCTGGTGVPPVQVVMLAVVMPAVMEVGTVVVVSEVTMMVSERMAAWEEWWRFGGNNGGFGENGGMANGMDCMGAAVSGIMGGNINMRMEVWAAAECHHVPKKQSPTSWARGTPSASVRDRRNAKKNCDEQTVSNKLS